MSRYWRKSWEMGIVAVRKDVTLLGKSGEMGIVAVRKYFTLRGEEWAKGYSGGT